jgi:hypothetical protein
MPTISSRDYREPPRRGSPRSPSSLNRTAAHRSSLGVSAGEGLCCFGAPRDRSSSADADDQLFFARKVVVDRLLGDLGFAGDGADGDVLVAPLGEQPGRDVGDELACARFLEFS